MDFLERKSQGTSFPSNQEQENLPTIADVIGMKNEELSQLKQILHVDLGNKENRNEIHTPDEQFQDGFEIPKWVSDLNIPKESSQGRDSCTQEVEYDNIEGSPKKKMRGTELVSHDCGTCGSFKLPSRYMPVLTSNFESMQNTIEKISGMENEIESKDKSLNKENARNIELE